MCITIGSGSVAGAATVAGGIFTFLPLLSLLYTHYGLLARCQTLRRRLEEHCSWEEAPPTPKEANCVPEPSTLRRWAHGLDCFRPAPSFLRQTLARIAQWLARGRRGSRGLVLVRTDSGSANPLASVAPEQFSVSPTILAWERCAPSSRLFSGGKEPRHWARISSHSNNDLPCSLTCGNNTIGLAGRRVRV